MKLKWRLVTTLIILFLFLFSFRFSAPHESIVETLPGYSGTLPFKLETGYISAGENEEVEFFYYFIESESEAGRDPLVLWLTGGPGCSAFSGLVYEIGPLNFDFEAFDDGSSPSFLLNPYSWTKIASIIFLDAPVGTGFTYATTSEGYHTSDSKTTRDIYTFLQKWLLKHPNFIKNRLYIAGDSYAGYYVPVIVNKISQGNEAGMKPSMNIQGYVIGNPGTDSSIDANSVLPFAHRLALLPDKYYQMAKVNCNGEYANPDPNNMECLYALQLYKECIRNIFQGNILEPACKFRSSKPEGLGWGNYLEDDPVIRSLSPESNKKESWCRNDNYVLAYVWANDPAVQEALHVKKGTVKEWKRCNKSLSYDQNEQNVVRYHKLLMKKGYEALVYSGDHDMVIPYIGTLKWIRLLNLSIDDDWRSWIVDAQVAGYTERYFDSKTQSYLTFATVKGAGHTAPEYNPKQCFVMLDRFFQAYPL